MNKERLLKYMQVAYANVEQIAAELNGSTRLEPALEGGWSVKDLIGHLAYWQQKEADYLRQARGETIERYYNSQITVDATNKIVYAQNRDKAWDDVVNDYRSSYRDLVAEIERLSDADLLETERFTWTGGDPLHESIANESYAHINEHLVELRNYIKSIKGQPWPRA